MTSTFDAENHEINDDHILGETQEEGIPDPLGDAPPSASSSVHDEASTLSDELGDEGLTGYYPSEDEDERSSRSSRVEDRVPQHNEVTEESTLPPVQVDIATAPLNGSESSGAPIGSPQVSPPSSFSYSRPTSGLSLRSTASPSPQPFERRFQARKPSLQIAASRNVSPGILRAHSRQVSTSSQGTTTSFSDEEDSTPWEVVRWTKLRKISSQVFSEAGKRVFGHRTYLAVAASIAIGTSKGLVLLFDYQQNLKTILGQGTPAAECGAVTSMAMSADHSTVAVGHAIGAIFTWDLSSPKRAFLQIDPISRDNLSNRASDAHVSGSAVLHVGFLGQRRTALVSADEGGMAFSHLATRGLGAVTRVVKTTRILGRYPEAPTSNQADLLPKPSSVLALSPLPLGNIEQQTDDMGLTAMLTPYLLVVVSTTPVAETQYKSRRRDDVTAHSALTGCLAWFPSVRLNSQNREGGRSKSKTKLAYCWSNVLSVLEMDVEEISPNESERRPSLHFRTRASWKCDEAIVAVQWLSRSVLVALTVTQQLMILEDKTLRLSDSTDLNPRHIYHRDVFSNQLQQLVDKEDQDEDSMHGAVADAYYMSFKAYKGRFFLLGLGDISTGILSNWADRLTALMEAGRLINAIELATSYYNGETDKLSVGLPEEDNIRHSVVQEKLLQIISGALDYIFKRDETDDLNQDLRSALGDLIEPIFVACVSMGNGEYLFDEVYEWYSDASCQDLFLLALEQRIVEGKVTVVPSEVLKDITAWYTSFGFSGRLEDIICSLDTSTMDLDQLTTICKTHNLYDAFIYIWNHALDDYITPLVELLRLAEAHNSVEDPRSEVTDEPSASSAKVFPYLAYALTGRVYPYGTDLPLNDANAAKGSLHGFIFSGRPLDWPKSSGKSVRLNSSSGLDYPYLRALLFLSTPQFMSTMNEAFEDGFLNGNQDQASNGPQLVNGAETESGWSMNRQRIVTILLEVLGGDDFSREDKIYLDIFIARNLPKFPQFLLLPSTTLRDILVELCHYPRDDLAEECQLSAEYLLSIHHPTDIQNLIPLFDQAGFFRILKSTYRASKQYSKWLETYFDDPNDQPSVFISIVDCLRPNAGLSSRQIQDVKSTIISHARDLALVDVNQEASLLRVYVPDCLGAVIERLVKDPELQFSFLKALIEPSAPSEGQRKNRMTEAIAQHIDLYIRLMCRFDPSHVSDFVGEVDLGNLQLDSLLPAMEQEGVIDAAVVLLAKSGLIKDAMGKLIRHLQTLQTAISGISEITHQTAGDEQMEESLEELLSTVAKYVKVGIWLCQAPLTEQGAQRAPNAPRTLPQNVTEKELSLTEMMWLNLIDAVVTLSRKASPSLGNEDLSKSDADGLDSRSKEPVDTLLTEKLRVIVQDTFTALLVATAQTSVNADKSSTLPAPTTHITPTHHDIPRFLPILQLFLNRTSASSPSLASIRQVLNSIFSAYAFESSLLSLSSGLLDKDVYLQVEEVHRQRRRGWRPRGRACERCGERVWGIGAGPRVWDDWKDKVIEKRKERARRLEVTVYDDAQMLSGKEITMRPQGKGKGKEKALPNSPSDQHGEVESGGSVDKLQGSSAVVVFACGHILHQLCLDYMHNGSVRDSEARKLSTNQGQKPRSYKCPLCHGPSQG
ncbi:MAG: Vacuolar protein sorting-associated protein 8 [Alyxoria varia]|nr:MAG: Vacuolar protein sorting-associated protein 8 [Alyxoria varia]